MDVIIIMGGIVIAIVVGMVGMIIDLLLLTSFHDSLDSLPQIHRL